ncbi:hypothetical protein K461DRAFT_294298 [Myriangium duriaei CBS 260.36]|uniref:Uncharacterized protein n=1 Tax=Myriangium duriaei CBS 260.36 TaxID=1168546 RepID=A0A9P4IZB6_9PEZI|nr:hypothetical protein K461DRAFT_294298 [Myriangium duriaei CBS 260.36]
MACVIQTLGSPHCPDTECTFERPSPSRHDSILSSSKTTSSSSSTKSIVLDTAPPCQDDTLEYSPPSRPDSVLQPTIKITGHADSTKSLELSTTSPNTTLDHPKTQRPNSLTIPSLLVTSPSETSPPAVLTPSTPSKAHLAPSTTTKFSTSSSPSTRITLTATLAPLGSNPPSATRARPHSTTSLSSQSSTSSPTSKSNKRSSLLIPLPVLAALASLTGRSQPRKPRFRPTYAPRFFRSQHTPEVKPATARRRKQVVSGTFTIVLPKDFREGMEERPAFKKGRKEDGKAPKCGACGDTRWVVARCRDCGGRGRGWGGVCGGCEGEGDRWVRCCC